MGPGGPGGWELSTNDLKCVHEVILEQQKRLEFNILKNGDFHYCGAPQGWPGPTHGAGRAGSNLVPKPPPYTLTFGI